MIRPATEADAVAMAPHLRAHDAAELHQSAGMTPLQGLRHGVRESTESWVWVPEYVAIAMWGVHVDSVLSGSAIVWLLTTTAVERHPVAFLRRSRALLRDLRHRYPCLHGLVDREYSRSRAWLDWLGATFHAPVSAGLTDTLFHPFEIRS